MVRNGVGELEATGSFKVSINKRELNYTELWVHGNIIGLRACISTVIYRNFDTHGELESTEIPKLCSSL